MKKLIVTRGTCSSSRTPSRSEVPSAWTPWHRSLYFLEICPAGLSGNYKGITFVGKNGRQ